MIKTSNSQLETYSNCSYAWYLSKVKRVKPMTAAWFMHGTAVHTALEKWEESGRQIDPVPVFETEYKRIIREELVEFPDESEWIRGGRKSRQTDILERLDKGKAQIKAWMDFAYEQPWCIWTLPDGNPALEVGFELELAGQIVVGYIDAIIQDAETGEVMVVDWKSGSKAPESDRQLGLYRLAVKELFGLDVARGGYGMLKDASIRWHDLSRYRREVLEADYGGLLRGIEAGSFIKRPGQGCFVCTVKKHCPLG